MISSFFSWFTLYVRFLFDINLFLDLDFDTDFNFVFSFLLMIFSTFSSIKNFWVIFSLTFFYFLLSYFLLEVKTSELFWIFELFFYFSTILLVSLILLTSFIIWSLETLWMCFAYFLFYLIDILTVFDFYLIECEFI